MRWLSAFLFVVALLIFGTNSGAVASVSDMLRKIPAPTTEWAAIVGHIAWPSVAVFITLRFRIFIRKFLNTLLERIKTDHVKIGLFELTPNSPVMVLDPVDVSESTDHYDSDDIQRIEAIFSFIDTESGWEKISEWVNQNFDPTLDIEDFITHPDHAKERAQAFDDIEGLEI
jgi:hypothetical protein